MLKSLARQIRDRATRSSRLKQLSSLLDAGLPPQMQPALEFLVTGRPDSDTARVSANAEGRRQDIASGGQKRIPIWYSPKPGSASADEARPAPGKELEFTLERIAATGKDQRWGTALYLIAREFKSTVALELGACAGISALYLASAPQMKDLITVEGSKPLSDIAVESLKSFANTRVVNALFDDAIDTELPRLEAHLDLAYIDGHHEKVATIHYFDKILPYLKSDSVVVFDDISWSQDMRDAWVQLSARPEFAHTLDLGAIGVCILGDTATAHWDLQYVTEVGHVRIGDPAGWK